MDLATFPNINVHYAQALGRNCGTMIVCTIGASQNESNGWAQIAILFPTPTFFTV